MLSMTVILAIGSYKKEDGFSFGKMPAEMFQAQQRQQTKCLFKCGTKTKQNFNLYDFDKFTTPL